MYKVTIKDDRITEMGTWLGEHMPRTSSGYIRWNVVENWNDMRPKGHRLILNFANEVDAIHFSLVWE